MMYKKTIMAEPGFVTLDRQVVGVCTAYQEPNGWKYLLHRLISGAHPEGSRIVTKSSLNSLSQIERNLHFIRDTSALDEIEQEVITIELAVPPGWVKLNGGKFLYKWYGKYMPNILYLNNVPEWEWELTKGSAYNLGAIPDLSMIRGKYFKTAKGADAFEADNNGEHVLLSDNWGGSFANYWGENSPRREDCLYQRLAASNAGRSGTTFSIVPFGYKATHDIDEL